MPKLITLYCGEPLGFDKEYRQPWSDVSVRFTGKPARKKYRIEPTLISRPRLERDILCERIDLNKHPTGPRLKLEQLEQILTLLTNETGIHIVVRSDDDILPVIYSASDYIDRTEAEKLLRAYLRTQGFKSVRFKWLRPKSIAYPT